MFESLFNKVAGLKAYNFIKKRLQHRCFPVKNICEQLLLILQEFWELKESQSLYGLFFVYVQEPLHIQYTVHGHDMRHESTLQYTDMRMHAFFQAMLNGDIYTQIALNNKWSFNWSLPQLGKQMPFPLNFQQKTGYLLLKSTMSIFLLKITVNDNFGFKPLLLKRCATLFCGNFLFMS